jgi:hypothetical protein
MKKVIGMVAAVAGVNVYNAQVTETAMSDMQLENIEALASGEPYTIKQCIGYCKSGLLSNSAPSYSVSFGRLCRTDRAWVCYYEATAWAPSDWFIGEFVD